MLNLHLLSLSIVLSTKNSIILPGGQSPQWKDPIVLIHGTIGAVEQPPLLLSHSLMSWQLWPFPCQPKKKHRRDIKI